ncbi:MAG: RNA polymerase sigma factor [Nannocystaceae bacterium]|nr:RNA polymerase sigma factor [Nannocystaceae bacterium]
MQSAQAVRREVCAPSLMRLAARLAGGSEEADDLVQATMVRALEHDVPVDRGPWLRRVLTNERNMWLRGRTRRMAREQIHADAPDVADAEDVVHALELAEIVRGLMDELDPSVREVVEARYFEGQTSAEVARALGVPAGTVRWRLKQGIDTLRMRLDRRYGGRRALWAGAALSLEKPPTLAASTASKGTMTLKILATVAALFTAGTAGSLAMRSGESDPADWTPSVGAVGLTVTPETRDALPATEPSPRTAKEVWADQRTEIRSALIKSHASAVALAPMADPLPTHFDSAKLAGEVSSIVGMCTEFMSGASSNMHLTAHVIGAPGTGTIVEEVTLSDGSDANAALAECLTESMYTLDLGEVQQPYEEDLQVYLQNSLDAPVLDGHEAHGTSITLSVPGEVPDDMQEVLKKALSEAGELPEGGGHKVMMLNADGVAESKSLEELPPELREMAEAAIQQAKSDHPQPPTADGVD